MISGNLLKENKGELNNIKSKIDFKNLKSDYILNKIIKKKEKEITWNY